MHTKDQKGIRDRSMGACLRRAAVQVYDYKGESPLLIVITKDARDCSRSDRGSRCSSSTSRRLLAAVRAGGRGGRGGLMGGGACLCGEVA